MKKILVGLVLGSGFLMAAGADIYKKCAACHGLQGDKVAPGTKGNITIGGMSKERLIEQLKGYRAGTADNGGAKAIMYANMKNFKLTDADIEAVAEYISKFPRKQ